MRGCGRLPVSRRDDARMPHRVEGVVVPMRAPVQQ
ncbi:transcriptional regulator [Xanthomonas campestris pv. passiflorae]|nr:transcriptional regulator [Xanthomonas campestris]MBV6813655.1 transcriptional regulator [Xanthomonas campestris pv. passiflorae]